MRYYILVRLQYLCWCIKTWMDKHIPYLPLGLRLWLLKRYPEERWNVSPWQYQFWQTHLKDMSKAPRPLPWPINVAAMGPFFGPWNRVSSWFGRHTGGRSHRCEFTDPNHGALHGHKEGAFMDKLFEQFLANIDGE